MKWLKYPEIFTNYHITRLPPAPEDRFPGVDILIRLHQCDELIRSHSIKHSLADRAVQILSTPISRLYGNR